MLIEFPAISARRATRREQRLAHDETRYMPSLGCLGCPQAQICGGLRIREPLFDCLDLCCGVPARCDRVCLRNPDYVDRVREIESYSLDTIPRTAEFAYPALPSSAPMLFHPSRRTGLAAANAIALPLARMYQRRTGMPRYCSPEALRNAFRIRAGTPIILSGTDHDASIERWWGLGEAARRATIRSLKDCSVALVTVPNYSLFSNVPRWDDLHAMKRIALIHYEFLSEGLPAALHVNGRTDTDFLRWTEYIAARPEIKVISYEFATGPGRAARIDLHVRWLCDLAAQVPHPLHLIVRGGIDKLPALRKRFHQVTFIDTASFMKTMMRQKATLQNGNRLAWSSTPTQRDEPLDALLAHNIASVEAVLTSAPAMPPARNTAYALRTLSHANFR